MPNVAHAYERLAVGPSRRDVVEHVRAREAWFGCADAGDDLYTAEGRWETPVVLWATPCLHDRLSLWKTCGWLRDRGIARRDVLIVDLPPRTRSPGAPPRAEPFDCGDSVLHQPDEVLRAQLAVARPWSRERYDEAVRLWEQYVSADPRRFARRCARGVPGFLELGPLWVFLSRFFPRLSADRSLRLGRYDDLLLGALSAEWQTPVKVYVRLVEEYSGFFSCVGDLTVEHRLAAWADHEASRAVERAPDPRHPAEESVYRLTERGVQLRGGPSGLADAPRLPVGGAEAYAPEAPWVVLGDGRLVRM